MVILLGVSCNGHDGLEASFIYQDLLPAWLLFASGSRHFLWELPHAQRGCSFAMRKVNNEYDFTAVINIFIKIIYLT
jgi:hypothetical protein